MTNLLPTGKHTLSKFKSLYIIFSLLLLIYMLWPGPSKIADFKGLPNSDKSKLAGDNIEQVPNVAGYFSNNFRSFIVPFYSNIYQSLSYFPFPPISLNHPPEYSWQVIKKHTDSTFIEELVYPLKGSLYVNGFEPISHYGLDGKGFVKDSTPNILTVARKL